eukprot:1230843-Amphidinium_carterae.1
MAELWPIKQMDKTKKVEGTKLQRQKCKPAENSELVNCFRELKPKQGMDISGIVSRLSIVLLASRNELLCAINVPPLRVHPLLTHLEQFSAVTVQRLVSCMHDISGMAYDVASFVSSCHRPLSHKSQPQRSLSSL